MTVNFKINSLDEDSDSILLWLQKEMVTEFKCICSVILQNSVNHKLECVCFHVYGNNNFNALFMEGCVTASDKQGLNTLVANFLMHSAFVSQNQLFFFEKMKMKLTSLRKWKFHSHHPHTNPISEDKVYENIIFWEKEFIYAFYENIIIFPYSYLVKFTPTWPIEEKCLLRCNLTKGGF